MKTEFLRERLRLMKRDFAWLAGECGVAEITITHNYMRGMVPSKSVLMLMARALKCDVKDLVHKEKSDTKTA